MQHTPPEQRITDLLLANNGNLLALICQTTFVGDAAANVSLGVLALLRKQNDRGTELFLKRLLRTRVEGYLLKSKDLSDIIRDNSMATMLLNAFARYEGLRYLGQSLTEPLKDILPYIASCEIDPAKFPLDLDPVSAQERMAENESRLKSACSRLLTTIVERREQMPGSLRRMCCFLRLTVDDIYDTGWIPAYQHLLKQPRAAAIQAGLIEETEALELESQSPVSPVGMVERAGSLKSPIESSPRHSALAGDLSSSAPKGDGSRLFGRLKPRGSLGSIQLKGTAQSSATASDSEMAKGVESKEPLTPTSTPLEGSSGGAGADSPNVDIRGSLKRKPPENLLISTQQHSAESPSSLGRPRAQERYMMPRMPSNNRSSISSNRAIGYLSIAEKIVGSFLFLRFFVPAITAPETYGLVEGKVSPASRRGLVLCGKVLTAMCNDVDFGNKEQYLMALNPFLRENREKIKDFLIFASSDVSAEESPHSEVSSGTPEPIRPSSAVESGELRKSQSRSMPSLKLPTASPTGARLPRTSSSDLADTSNFYHYLGRALPKIEQELDDHLNNLTPEASEGVLPNFLELKRCIEQSGYGDPALLERTRGRNQTLFSRLSAKWNLKGLFQGSRKARSQSLDDLSIGSTRMPRKNSISAAARYRNSLIAGRDSPTASPSTARRRASQRDKSVPAALA
ncbi:hypothetical protein DFS34DRAFT_613351 [Phlyctochytrium arcticum]|nr:hypothetical protein DFS34DRAFT_613351 [Phlyctochytrium arcticum]